MKVLLTGFDPFGGESVILHGEAENDQLFSAFFSAVSIAFKRIMEVYF